MFLGLWRVYEEQQTCTSHWSKAQRNDTFRQRYSIFTKIQVQMIDKVLTNYVAMIDVYVFHLPYG